MYAPSLIIIDLSLECDEFKKYLDSIDLYNREYRTILSRLYCAINVGPAYESSIAHCIENIIREYTVLQYIRPDIHAEFTTRIQLLANQLKDKLENLGLHPTAAEIPYNLIRVEDGSMLLKYDDTDHIYAL